MALWVLGRAARPGLRAAVAGVLSAEQADRVERLLAAGQVLPPCRRTGCGRGVTDGMSIRSEWVPAGRGATRHMGEEGGGCRAGPE